MNAHVTSINLRNDRSVSRRLRRAVLSCVETLEARAMLSGTPSNFTITDADNHVLALSLQGVNLTLVDSDTTAGTSQTLTQLFNQAAPVAITGGSGADVLQVDFSGFTPNQGPNLVFTGGGASNSLVLLNGNYSTNTVDETAGTLALDTNPLIYFANVGSVVDLTNSGFVGFNTGTGNETLNVTNGSVVDGLQTTEIAGPNLVYEFANKGFVQVNSNSNQTLNLSSSAADAALYEFEIDSLAASDTVSITATPSTVYTVVTSDYVSPPPPSGPDYVTIGNGTLDGIQGQVEVSDDAGGDSLVINDSADTASQVVNYDEPAAFFIHRQVSGLTAQPILFTPADLQSLTVMAGSGGNTFNVVNTVPNSANVLDTGTGNDTVNVQFVAGNAPLTINGQGGQDTVVVGFTTNNPAPETGYSNILSPISVSNAAGATNLVIDTTAEAAAQTITAGNGVVTVTNQVPNLPSPTSVAISYSAGAPSGGTGVTQVTMKTGAGADTINLTPDAATAFNLDAGGPSTVPGDTLNVNFTGASGAVLDAVTTAGYAHTYSFANQQPIAFTNVESYPAPVVASADLAVSLVGPAAVGAGGSMTYAFKVTNSGPGNAASVMLADTLPAGTSFLSAGQFLSTLAGNVLTLNLGALASGATVSGTITLAAGVGPASLSNVVSVSSELPDPQTANNVASATTLVRPPPPVLGSVAISSPINEGGTATLTGRLAEVAGSGAMQLVVNWGPGQASNTYVFAVGTTSFSVTHAYLDNPAAPATSFPIALTLSNAGGSVAAATSVVVKDLAPVAKPIVGLAAAVRGQSLNFADAFTDAGVLDTHTAVFKWGDGTTSAGAVTELHGAGSIAASHLFKASGTYVVSLTITDKDGLSTTVTQSVKIGSVLVEPDPVYGGNMLVVGGTTAADTIDIKSTKTGVSVNLNGVKTDVTSPFGRIVVYGQAGSDTIQVDKKVTNNAFLYAGPGGSYLQGGGGNNVLVGGTGNDILVGGAGRNVLIGGGGADMLFAGSADDLLLSGSTTYAGNDAALAAIFNEWTRTTDSYATRIHAIQFGGGLNGSYVFNSSTLINNSTGSVLFGGSGNDWFIANKKDWVLNRRASETMTLI